MPLLPCQRALFEIPADIAYFDCAKMSPLLQAAALAGETGLRRKSRPWEIGAEHFFDESERVRSTYARLIGAAPGDVAIVPSVSYGMAIVTANLPVAAGQSIVTLGEDFPSGIYAARALARRAGADVVTVPRPPAGGDWSAAILAAIDQRTALVISPHVHWIHGSVLDLEAIGRRCRAFGAALVLDTTQSTGALPLDLQAVDPDYMITASYKWLLGPYSLGFLYVALRRQQGQPLEEGWITRRGADDFRSLAGYSEALEPNARRFDMGERSNFALLPVAGAAIAQLLDWGIANIAETLGAITARIEALLAPYGIEAGPDRAPHFLSLRWPGPLPEGIEARLAAANVHVSIRGDSIRITPHLYNHDDDIESLVRHLAQAAEAG